jgi:hypothetical protein
MKKFNRNSILAVIFLLNTFLFNGCKDNDIIPPPCSCEAPTTKSFESSSGVLVSTIEGYFFLSPTEGFYKPCNDTDLTLLKDGLIVLANGKIKTTCLKPDDLIKQQQQSYVSMDSWTTTQDSLFRGSVNIKLIRSEDYGYSKGYGYIIKDTKFTGTIIQPFIPAIGGYKAFKTKTEAYKVAMLVAYKLNLKIGLPSITIQDLRFLQIEYY